MSYVWTTTRVPIDVNEITRNVVRHTSPEHRVDGEGVFDILMMTATEHLLAQLEAGRIRGEDYANAYVQLYQATLGAAIQAWVQKAESLMKEALYARQIEGFNDDLLQKVLKIQLDSWNVGFSVARDTFQGSAGGVPQAMVTGTTTENNVSIPTPELPANIGSNVTYQKINRRVKSIPDEIVPYDPTPPPPPP